MASIRVRAKKDGSNTYTVNWREPGGGVESRSFAIRSEAQDLKDFLDANGNSFKLAAEGRRRKDSKAPTVLDIVTQHIDLLRKPQPGTILRYRNLTKNHIAGTDLGAMPIDRVNATAVLEWFDGLTVARGANQTVGEPLARKTKETIQALVSAAFKTANEAGKMTGNPAKGIGDADLNDAREPVYISPVEIEVISDAVPERYKLFIQFLGGTGLRYNEATALRKRDITVKRDTRIVDGVEEEFDRCIVSVNRAWKSGGVGKGEVIGPPKTPKAKRNVTCNLTLSAALVEHIRDLGLNDLVFTRENGKYLRNAVFHKYVWQPTMKDLVKSGMLDEKPWIHEIRHAHTTHLLKRGVPVHIVQARLGHEDPQTTLRVYARMSSGDDEAAADALD